MMTISDFFERNKKLESRKIFAGFSGGADSTALLLMLAQEADTRGFKLKAVHFEHGLRGKESAADGLWCRQFCESRKIDYMEIPLNVKAKKKAGESTESAARRLRLNEWEILAGNQSSLVALAHNANDKVENVFLRLLRGSNVSGLTSLREIQKIGNVTFIRPILSCKRKEIEDFLRTNCVNDWRIDSSNADNEYRRNFFRNKIIPLISEQFPNADSSVLKSVHALEQDADFIETAASGMFKSIKDRESIDTAYLKAMHPSILIRFMRHWISEATNSDYIPDGEFIQRFNTELNRLSSRKSSAKKSVLLPLQMKSLFLCIKKENISFYRHVAKSANEPQIRWKWELSKELCWGKLILKSKIISRKTKQGFTRGEDIVYFDAGLLSELTLRECRNGDVMVPFGKTTKVHLKKIFESGKIPSDRKRKIPVVCNENGEIIWIPGVRRANFANIGPATKRIAVFTSENRS